MLTVVEHDQHLVVAQEFDECRLEREVLALLHLERGRHGLDHCSIVTRRRELDDTRRAQIVGRSGGGKPERKPRLAHAPRPDQGHQSLALEQCADGGEVVVATDEPRGVERESERGAPSPRPLTPPRYRPGAWDRRR